MLFKCGLRHKPSLARLFLYWDNGVVEAPTLKSRSKERIMNNQATTTKEIKKLNGLDTTQMMETVAALKDEPSLAKFNFRARNQWIDGGENRSAIQGFYGAGREDDSRETPFELTNGEPPMLLGNNEGANPVEYLLHALAGCVTTTMVIHAAARGIRLTELSTELDGDMDLQGLLGLAENTFPGYESIRIKMDVKADCSDEELEDLLEFVRGHSPVCSTVCKPVPVEIVRVTAANAS
jgi:uncharacterized OsmC-like protein